MHDILIRGAKVITETELLEGASVLIQNGKIAELYPESSPFNFNGEVIEANGLYLSPGFIDIHTHGGGGHDFMDATPEAFLGAAKLHAQHGTTTLLPTTLAGDNEELYAAFDAFHQIKNMEHDGARMPGLHLEGPYFSAEFKGAQDEKYLKKPTPENYQAIYERSQGSILRWSAAPELDKDFCFASFLKEKGISASIAHTSATCKQVEKAFLHGYDMMTHLYCAMSSIKRTNGYRTAGALEAFYLLDDMKAELIADGCHLPPELLRLAYKSKGADRLVLVTDSMRAAGMPEGESILGSLKNGQKIVVKDGVAVLLDFSAFAGSVCTANRLVRTMVKQAEIPLVDAVKMIATTPAKVIQQYDVVGSIIKGKMADLVLFDEDININMTMIGGKIVYQNN